LKAKQVTPTSVFDLARTFNALGKWSAAMGMALIGFNAPAAESTVHKRIFPSKAVERTLVWLNVGSAPALADLVSQCTDVTYDQC
jgi:hypothetical protein